MIMCSLSSTNSFKSQILILRLSTFYSFINFHRLCSSSFSNSPSAGLSHLDRKILSLWVLSRCNFVINLRTSHGFDSHNHCSWSQIVFLYHSQPMAIFYMNFLFQVIKYLLHAVLYVLEIFQSLVIITLFYFQFLNVVYFIL